MFGLFSKRRTNRVQAPATRDMVMKTVSDAGGFDFGVIWQPSLGQGTILLAGETSFSLEDIAAWRRVASTVIGVTVISTIVVSGEDPAITYAFVTFDAEKKSCDDFLTWLAKQVVQVYSPEELEIMWWPQDAESVTRHACTLWAPDSDPVFPPVAQTLVEHYDIIQCDQVYRVAFEILLSTDAAEDFVQEFEDIVSTSMLQDGEKIHFVEIVRPLDPTFVLDDAGFPFRRDGIIVLSAPSSEQVEDFTTDLVASLSPRTRLHLTRLFGRQHIGVLLAGGVPAYGWQLTSTFVK